MVATPVTWESVTKLASELQFSVFNVSCSEKMNNKIKPETCLSCIYVVASLISSSGSEGETPLHQA